jgi:radical SAM superfamily enzyme YgiQ (UPF0313 family)
LKVLFINLKEPLKETQKQSLIPPIGLWKMRDCILQFKNNEVDICDENIGDRTEDYIRDKAYDIIGISARFSIQHREYKRIAQLCEGKAYVIAGGIHAINYGKVKGIDEVVTIPGELWFAMKNQDCNYQFAVERSISRFSLEEIKKYWDAGLPHDLKNMTPRWMPIETSRGCVNNCHFCGVKKLWGKCWTPFSKSHLTKLFKYLKKQGVKELFIEDDNISLNKERFFWILKQFKKYNFYWSCPNGIQVKHLLNKEVLEKIWKTKCWRLSLPFETGSHKTAMNMRLWGKWITYNEAKSLVDKLNNMGIQTCGFFIIGYPEETEKEIKETLNYANNLPLTQRNIYIATPYPGTDLFEQCLRKGYINFDESFYDNLMYTKGLINTEFISAEEIEKIKFEDRRQAIEKKERLNYVLGTIMINFIKKEKS